MVCLAISAVATAAANAASRLEFFCYRLKTLPLAMRLLVLVLANLSLGSAIVQLHFDRGTSAANATFSAYVKAYVTCSNTSSPPSSALQLTSIADCPPWIRVDRVDGVADVSPFNSIINEAVSFRNSQLFPFWIQVCPFAPK